MTTSTYNGPTRRLNRGHLARLRAAGFDLSTHVPFSAVYRPRCSRCEAMVINGTATHERGCPNAASTRKRLVGCGDFDE